MTEARSRAARALLRVLDKGHFAKAALDEELRREPAMSSRDAGLCTELVYGVLRTKGGLEEDLKSVAHSNRLRGLSTEGLAHLLIAAYAIRFLDRVPDFASVDEAVECIKKVDGPRPANFSNGLLRALAGKAKKAPANRRKFVEANAPAWLRGSLRKALGRGPAREFIMHQPPALGTGICVPGDREKWKGTFEELALELGLDSSGISLMDRSPHGLVLKGMGDPYRLAGHETDWIVQEEGAQLLCLALGLKPGECVLDACSGRGNKSVLLAEAVGPSGRVVAADLSKSKLEGADPATLRARSIADRIAVDWTGETSAVADSSFDVVLVDAPCSGTGTLARRPEIMFRLHPEDVPRLADLQVEILNAAAAKARPGGYVVYAVCSILPEETEGVVSRADPTLLEPAELRDAQWLDAPDGAMSARLLPNVHGTDAFYLAAFRRRTS